MCVHACVCVCVCESVCVCECVCGGGACSIEHFSFQSVFFLRIVTECFVLLPVFILLAIIFHLGPEPSVPIQRVSSY